jgi:cytochrome P450
VSHAFSDKALHEQEQLLKGYAVLLATQLKKVAKDGVPQNMVRWYNFTTFDIMADLTFGEPLKLLDGNEYTPWVEAIFANIKMVSFVAVLREWPGFQTILSALIPSKIKEDRKQHMKYSVDRVEKRLARETDRPDIWTYVMRHSQSEDKGKSLLPTEMRSNAALFMLAGTETTATALSGLTYYLLKNPKKMERLTKEIRDAFPAYDNMNMNDLAKLPYLCACIEEGLRIYPPVSIGMPRRTPKGGAEVAGRWIPGGVSLAIVSSIEHILTAADEYFDPTVRSLSFPSKFHRPGFVRARALDARRRLNVFVRPQGSTATVFLWPTQLSREKPCLSRASSDSWDNFMVL